MVRGAGNSRARARQADPPGRRTIPQRAQGRALDGREIDHAVGDHGIERTVLEGQFLDRKVFAEAARVLRPGGRLAISDIVTARPIARRTACQADFWAACIAGASQRDLYLEHIAAAGLELEVIQANPDYHFTSERAQRTSHKYGAHSVSLLALKPVRASRHISNPDLGGGADVAQAAWEEGSTNTTTTSEVSS